MVVVGKVCGANHGEFNTISTTECVTSENVGDGQEIRVGVTGIVWIDGGVETENHSWSIVERTELLKHSAQPV